MLQIFLILLILCALTAGVNPLQKHFPKQQANRLLWIAFSIYVVGNLYFTVFSRSAGSGTHMDMRPFGIYLRSSEDIDANFQNVTGFAALFLKNISPLTGIILNILLYYPMGYLLTVLCPGLKAWHIILIGCAASVSTEFTQFLLKMGWCEMDDILLNTLGTSIGLWVRYLQNKYIQKRKVIPHDRHAQKGKS